MKGWPGGEEWINSATLLARKQVMARVFRAEEMPDMESGGEARMARRLDRSVFDADRFFAAFSGDEQARRAQAEKLVLALPAAQPFSNDGRLDFVRHLVLDPAYQLK